MQKKNIIRAWKDEGYRQSLSEDERARLPPHPAGSIELTDSELGSVAGGTDQIIPIGYGESFQMATWGCCPTIIHGCGTHYLGGWSFGCCPPE